MTKRLVAFVLAFAFSFALLAGCSSEKPPAPKKEDAPKTEEKK